MKRREALSRLTVLVALAAWRPTEFRRLAPKPLEHPEPRPGITSEHVLADADLPKNRKKMHDAYSGARAYPELFDGLCCGCDCRESMGHRSLLSCYESKQPQGCLACQEEAWLVADLAKQGKSLADIRTAVDKKFG